MRPLSCSRVADISVVSLHSGESSPSPYSKWTFSCAADLYMVKGAEVAEVLFRFGRLFIMAYGVFQHMYYLLQWSHQRMTPAMNRATDGGALSPWSADFLLLGGKHEKDGE